MIAYPQKSYTMTISLLGDIYSTDHDCYIAHLETKKDTNRDGQVMKMDIQQHLDVKTVSILFYFSALHISAP